MHLPLPRTLALTLCAAAMINQSVIACRVTGFGQLMGGYRGRGTRITDAGGYVMRHRFSTHLLVAASIVAAGLAVAVPAFAGSASRGGTSPGTADRTIHVVAQLSTGVELDLGKKGVSVGDQFIFSGRLVTPGTTARRVGRIGGYCVLDNLSPHASECTMTAVLSGGQISVQGEQIGVPTPHTVTNAIVGGTGAFRNARGDVIQRFVSPPLRDLTFRLILQP